MPAAPSFEYDVFISYSGRDAAWVHNYLLPRIENAGLRTFIDRRDFDVGALNIKEIERGISRSRRTLAVLTPHYVASEWCELETVLLQTESPTNKGNRLIPLLLKECPLPPRLSALAFLDFTDGDGSSLEWRRLIAALRARSGDTTDWLSRTQLSNELSTIRPDDEIKEDARDSEYLSARHQEAAALQELAFRNKWMELTAQGILKADVDVDYINYIRAAAASHDPPVVIDTDIREYITASRMLTSRFDFWFRFLGRHYTESYLALQKKDSSSPHPNNPRLLQQIYETLRVLGVQRATPYRASEGAHFGGRLGSSILFRFFNDVQGVPPHAIECELGESPPSLPPLLRQEFEKLSERKDDQAKCHVLKVFSDPDDAGGRHHVLLGKTSFRLTRAWRNLKLNYPTFAENLFDRIVMDSEDLYALPTVASVDFIPETTDAKLLLSLRSASTIVAPNMVHSYGETMEPSDFDSQHESLHLGPALNRALRQELGLMNQPHIVKGAKKYVFGLNLNLEMPSVQFLSQVSLTVSSEEMDEFLPLGDSETKRPMLLDFRNPEFALDVVIDGRFQSENSSLSRAVYMPCRMLLLHLARRKFSDQQVLDYLRLRIRRGGRAAGA